ncbi:disease resistance protein Pik-1-like [Miscanthus floridulus]|uniref:disease resistance protein Pik-1-like n=1 Tax=Miscanthus floridulus TaxID=154761 RepID=UPI0034597E53
METELSIIAALLTTLSPQHFDDAETKKWLGETVPHLADRVLGEVVDPSRHTLLRRASQCFHRRKSFSYWYLIFTVLMLYYIIEHPCSPRYRHLLLPSSDLGLITPQLAEADALLPLVGIDRPAKKILGWFAHQGKMDMNLRVLCIIGPVGIGKTTLAVELRNRLREHHETGGGRYNFQCNVMAQVPRGTDRNIRLVQDILSQVSEPAATALSSDPSQAKTMEVLVRLISECLRDKRYFVIIDDIWEASDWEEIKVAFPNNNHGSRILITTRSTSTAWACCSDSYDGLDVHEMKPLSEMDSERLLIAKAVGSVDGCLPNNMKLHCDEVLRRCEGIPLFIIGMADWLKDQRLQQLHQREDEDEEHQRFAIYCKERVPRLTEQALSSAFNDFPNDYLRLLLIYMSMFPYGYKFEKDRLIWKWIDEGFFILTGYNYGLYYFDIYFSHVIKLEAERLFSELVDSNVITCVASNCKHKQDEAEACQWQINHFMHQFLASKSAEMGFVFTTTTLNLLAESAAATTTECGNQTSSRMPRRLALYHPDPLFPSMLETMDLSQTRSLSVSGTVCRIPLNKFVNLVLLDLEGWENLKDEDLVQVCRSKMIFLRYLSVRNTRVSKLPHEIKELRILGTLDVSYTQITELPLEVFELIFLWHLDLRGTRISQLPKQIKGLRHVLRYLLVETAARVPNDVRHLYKLETLATVDLTEYPASFLRALGDLHNLEVLAVTWSFHQSTDRDYCEALLSSIKNWENLESLTIHCGLGCSMEFLGSLEKSRAPRWLKKFKVTAGRFASVPPWALP